VHTSVTINNTNQNKVGREGLDMLQRISEFPQMAWAAASGAVIETVSKLKADERGLSGVVVAILLILVAVLAIVLIWGFLSGWLQDLWEQITQQADTIQ